MTPAEKTSLTKDLARKLGFDRVGVAALTSSPKAQYYREWLAAGHAGSMRYLHRNVSLRENPARLLPGARSAICVALGYHRREAPPPTPGNDSEGRVAQYVRGADYHRVMRGMLEDLMARLRGRLDEPFQYRAFVDTGPLLERELAAAAGLGWVGKNTMLLHEELGSYLFLGEVLTTIELLPDPPAVDRCGSCTRCLDACPTNAFPGSYRLDASRCIAYLTIEHRSDVPEEFHPLIGDWVYGCDVCQQVCPYNHHASPATRPELASGGISAHVPLLELVQLRSGEYRRLTNGTAARRARRNMWRRNAAIALGNAPRLSPKEQQALSAAGDDEDPAVRHAARHALKRTTS
jgi:epoxyqueuosine reductase